MARQCIICKKELSSKNKGFLCQYHKDLAKEKAKKGGEIAAGVAVAVGTAGKAVYDHREEILAAAKTGVNAVKKVVKNL